MSDMRDLIAGIASKIPETDDTTPLETHDEPAGDAGDPVDEPAVETPVDEPADPAAGEGDDPGAAEPVVEVPGADPAAPGADPAAVPAVAAVPAAPAQTDKQKQLEAFAAEHKLGKDKLGRFNRIPHDVVATRIVPNAIKKAKAEWEEKSLKPLQAINTEYEGRLKVIEDQEKIMFNEPRRMLTILQQIPGYKEIYAEMGLKGTLAPANAADGTKVAQPAVAEDPMPGPDVKDANGVATGWTQDGLEKRWAWERREAVRMAKAESEAVLAPYKKRVDSETAREQDEKHIDAVLDGAKEWPGFMENTAAILDVFSKDTSDVSTPAKMQRALDKAYKQVMFGVVTKARETEEEKRARYYAERDDQLRKAPRAATAAVSSVARHEPATAEELPASGNKQIIMDSLKSKRLI